MYDGRVRAGRGLAADRMADSTILETMEKWFGMRFVPGTLNLVLAHPFDRPAGTVFVPSSELGPHWEERTGQAGYYCTPVLVDRIHRGIAMQAEEDGYPPEQVEIICEVHLRSTLGVGDGDSVRFAVVEDPVT